jgi:hypothetical protein
MFDPDIKGQRLLGGRNLLMMGFLHRLMLLVVLLPLITACGKDFSSGNGLAVTPVNQGQLTPVLATQIEKQTLYPSKMPSSPTLMPTGIVQAKPSSTLTNQFSTPIPTYSATPASQTVTCQTPDQSEPLSQMMVPGVIAYQDNTLGKFAIIGGSPWVTTTLPIPGRRGEDWQYSLIGFSPDGEWLAYRPYKENDYSQLSFLSSQETISKVPVNYKELLSSVDGPAIFSGYSTYTWVNDQLLHAEVHYQENTERPNVYPFEGIIDWASGKWMESLFLDLPGSEYKSNFERPLDAVYSPDLSLVLFPPTNLGYGLVLWDLENKKELNFDKAWGDGGVFRIGLYAAWAPDSSKVAYIRLIQSSSIDDLVILDRNGQQAQIQSPIRAVAGFTYFLSWSPDSRYLAFSVLREENPLGTETLLVYDSKSQKITFQCLLKIDRNRYSWTRYYWSPDSRFLAYSMAVTQPVNVIDTQTGRIEVLPVIGMPFGWSDKFSTKKEK